MVSSAYNAHCMVDADVYPSQQLRIALVEILDIEGAVQPRRVKFFRGQMQTIISRALADLDITPVPSRRCFSLISKYLLHLRVFSKGIQ